MRGAAVVCLALVVGAVPAAAEERGAVTSPPKASAPFVEYTYPGHFFSGDVTELSAFGIQFTKPVVGVRAPDLTVNGSPAMQVTGEGAGPYVFSGYAPPALGPVTLRLAPGEIRDAVHGVAFAGDSWTRQLFASEADDDGDGLANAREIELFLNPRAADTDGDGMPDVFEVTHPCLEAFVDESKPQEMYGVIRPGDPDADDDGVANLDEFTRGTDPCVAQR